ncbi:MAG TPA: FAD-dependent oxidoreductase, partial [Cryomorphaceae bacterium]|nr:FAD-dependent oxidoreductase [Cryomorphaceae bacterium]
MAGREVFDIAIIGGGIVGAATLYKIQKRHPELKLLLIEKEELLADHQTGNNSGVIHSGLYYKPGSLKARNCVDGRKELVAFAQEHGVDCDVCGKVVVAADESELPMLDKIFQIGIENGIEGIEKIDREEIKRREPHCEGIAGIWVPVTGIIDYRQATEKMVELALDINSNSKLALGEEVRDIRANGETKTLVTNKGSYESRFQVFCAGLQADRLARKDKVVLKEQVVGFRGDYYELTPEARHK